jgi:hypothetical protein
LVSETLEGAEMDVERFTSVMDDLRQVLVDAKASTSQIEKFNALVEDFELDSVTNLVESIAKKDAKLAEKANMVLKELSYFENLRLNNFFELAEQSRIFLDTLNTLESLTVKEGGKGKLFEVDLAPDEEHMLDWSESRNEQSDYVKNLFKDVFPNADEEFKAAYKAFKDFDQMLISKYGEEYNELRTDKEEKEYGRLWTSQKQARNRKKTREVITSHNATGERIYKDLSATLGSDQQASIYLNSIGIPGIKYLNGPSRGKGKGEYNYVVFNDAAIEVLDKYSVKKQPTGTPSVEIVLDEKKAPVDLKEIGRAHV